MAVHEEVVGADVEAVAVHFDDFVELGDARFPADVHVVIDVFGSFFAEDDDGGGVHALGFGELDFVIDETGVDDVGVFIELGFAVVGVDVVALCEREVSFTEVLIGGADHDSGIGDGGLEDEHGPAFMGFDAAAEVFGFVSGGLGRSAGDHDSAVVVGVHDEEDANLSEVGLASDGVCLGLGALEGGEEDGDE